MKTFLVSPPPYLHSGESVESVYLTYGLALLPAFALCLIRAGWQGLAFAAACLAAAVALEAASARLLRGASHACALAALYDAALFVVLVGAQPAPAAVGAIALALFFAKMVFGGVGRALFSPACVAFLAVGAFPLGDLAIASGPALAAAALAGGGLAVWRRLVCWEEAAGFLGIVGLAGIVRGAPPGALAARADWVLAAFFLLPALGPRPLARRAAALVALGAGILSAGLEAAGAGQAAVPLAVLVANAFAPAISRRFASWQAR